MSETLRFFVQDSATNLGVPGLIYSSFSSIKISQDGTPSSDVKATIALVEEGGGWYNFAITDGQAAFKCLAAIPIPSTATHQGYGVTFYPPARAGAAMDLVDTLKHKAGTAGYDRTTDSLEALGEKPNAGAKMDLVDTLVHKSGATGYDRTTDSLEAVGDKVQNLPASPAAVGSQMDLKDAPNGTAITALQNGLSKSAGEKGTDAIKDETATIKGKTDLIVTGGATQANVTAVGNAVVAVADLINALKDFDPGVDKVMIANDGLSAASISTAALDKFCKMMGMKREVSADGLQIKLYTISGALSCTLTRSVGAPYIWTPVFV